MKKVLFAVKYFGLIVLFSFPTQLLGQGCSSTSIYPFEWPAHNNWFVAPANEWTGTILNMTTLTTTVAGTALAGDNLGAQVGQYEGTTAVSDENGNLLMYSNGRIMWTGVGNGTTQTYNGLLEGNEGGSTSNRGSGTQGIISIRHPNAPNDIHVFTTDDANSGPTVGLNHFVFDLSGNLTAGPTRLGSYRTTEAVAATHHNNGIDIWVTAMDVNGNYYTYLITCTGIDFPNSNLAQAGGPTSVAGNSNHERGGLTFSYDGQKIAQAHGSAVVAEKISLYDFNNTTGAITNRMDICQSNQIYSPYDLIFSPDNQRLFVSFQQSTVDYYDLSSGVPATITASRLSTGLTTGVGSAIEMGTSGKLYIGSGVQSKGLLREIQENINSALTFTTVDIAGAYVSLGLPTMFIPPVDKLLISDPGTLCDNDSPFDLATSWVCTGGDGEAITHTYKSTQGNISDVNIGTYDPSISGLGIDTVIFTATGSCASADTLILNIIDCNGVSTQLVQGEQVLDVYPNPTTNQIKFNSVSRGTFEIRNVHGVVVSTGIVSAGINVLGIDELQPGVYNFRVQIDGIRKVSKIIKQ